MFYFIRVAMVMESLHSVGNNGQKLLPGIGYCCDRPGHAFAWRNVDFWDFGKWNALSVA
jgi:hypothetical protein